MDKMTLLEYEQALKSKIQLFFFMGLVKQINEGEYSIFTQDFTDYKKKLMHVSDRINKWHFLQKERNKKEFTHDADFLDIINSPNDFFDSIDDSSSYESQNEKSVLDQA